MDNGAAKTTRSVPFAAALKFWLKLGFISFGGPAGQIAIMHQELVERRRWISEKRFLHALNFTMMLPGPEAQQLATYTGWLMNGVRGGIAAGVMFVLPSFFILCALAWIYLSYGNVPAIQGILYGIKPAVTAIVVFSAYRIGTRALKNPIHWIMAFAAFAALTFLKVPFPYIVFSAGLFGFIAGVYRPSLFDLPASHDAQQNDSQASYVIGDDDPPSDHMLFSWVKVLICCIVVLDIWCLLMWALFYQYGWEGTLTQIGWFFTKAAMVTFGGAYAVLPYVYQGAVESYGWLTPAQMIDGMALGETTPGPLIMVVTFVGYVGAWTSDLADSTSMAVAGFTGATVATLVTFLPSFLFILVGAPMVEGTRDNLKFTAPLNAITAAVVGVILNLAVYFGYHVLWPTGFQGNLEWPAMVMGIAAFVLLYRFKLGVIPLILLAGFAGLAYQLLTG